MLNSIAQIGFIGMLIVSGSAVAGPPPNDDCANMIEVFDGGTQFSTIEATTDGPAHEACDYFQDNQINQDIWFRYAATAANQTFSLCLSEYDTKIAVYIGTECPPTDANLIACNDDSCNLRSEVVVPLIINQCYTIRIGGYTGQSGTGTLHIGGPVIECFGGEGPCCDAHLGLGCYSKFGCCPLICNIDSFCCSVSWDEMCVQLATEYCVGGCGNGDANASGTVDVDDLLLIINNWGDCPCLECPGDVSNSGEVDVDDLLQVINDWSV